MIELFFLEKTKQASLLENWINILSTTQGHKSRNNAIASEIKFECVMLLLLM